MEPFFFSLIPSTFPALALAHFLALLSPGPDFFLVVGHAVRRGLRGAVFICLGIAMGNAVYIIAAITGGTAIKHTPPLYRILEIAGAAFLVWLGGMLIRSARRSTILTTQESPSLSPIKQFSVGFGSALLNPKNAIFYLTLMTIIIGPRATLAQQLFSGTWMVLLVFGWDAAVAALIGHPKIQRAIERKIPFVEGIAGGFLVILAISLIIHPF